MASLYQLTDELLYLQRLIDESDGELTPEIEAAIVHNVLDSNEKLDGYCELIGQAEAFERRLREKAAILEKRARSQATFAARLKRWLMESMEKRGLRRWDTENNRVWMQANPPSIEYCGDARALPAELQIVRYDLLKKAALDMWKEGKQLPDGVVVEQKQSLRIQ